MSGPRVVCILVAILALTGAAIWLLTTAGSRAVPKVAELPATSMRARWRARVVSTEGTALEVSTPCEVDAVVGDRGVSLEVAQVVVLCGGSTVYDSAEAARAGTAARAASATRFPYPVDVVSKSTGATEAYSLTFEEHGATTRLYPAVSIDTARGRVRVARESPPAMRLELDVQSRSEGELVTPARAR